MPELQSQRSCAAYIFCWNSAELSDWVITNVHAHKGLSRIVVVAPLASDLCTQELLPAPTEIIPRLVALTSEPSSVIRHSIPRTYSLSPSTEALKSLYPFVTERQRHAVDQGPLEPDSVGCPIVVVIDMPGYEALVFTALKHAGLWDDVKSLNIRAAAEVYFDDANDVSDVKAQFDGAGFTLSARNDNDPDWPELCFTRDLHALHLQRLEQQVSTLRETLQLSTATLEATERERDIALTNLESAQAALHTALSQAETERDEAKASLNSLTEVRDQLKVDNEALIRRGEQSQKDKIRTEETLRVRTAELEREENTNAELKAQLVLARDEIRRAEGQLSLIQNLLLRQREF